MKSQLQRNIKEIIEEHPAVGNILEEHGIACVTCNVGTCVLADIIEIHNLPTEDERTVLTKIAEVIFPGKHMEIPVSNRTVPEKTSYSPPVKQLVKEHTHIKKVIAKVPSIISELQATPQTGRSLVRNAIEFIRFYADKYHHAKEEDILFSYCDDSAEIFQVMYRDHETARAHVAAITTALDGDDDAAIISHLESYAALLTEHIRKEDEVLYPWIDRSLSITQVGELFTRFGEVEVEFGDQPRQLEAFAAELAVR